MTKDKQSDKEELARSIAETEPGGKVRLSPDNEDKRLATSQAEFWAQRRAEGATQAEIDAARESLPPIPPMTGPEQFLGISLDELEEAGPESQPPERVEKPLPLWFKVLIVAIVVLPILFFAGRVHYDSHENIKDTDWQKFMDQGCRPTNHGMLKKSLYDDLDLWVHVNISMNSWMRATQGDAEHCLTRYPTPADETKRLQCLTAHRQATDWFWRCKTVVINECQKAGGACR